MTAVVVRAVAVRAVAVTAVAVMAVAVTAVAVTAVAVTAVTVTAVAVMAVAVTAVAMTAVAVMLEPPQGYVCNVPLPKEPQRQSTTRSQVHTIPDYYEVPYVVPTYTTPLSIVESAAYAFSPAWHAIAIHT